MAKIFLIGYMGCGKTTLGRALARDLDVPFVDLDEYIEARVGMSVREIFATTGESGFRRIETESLAAVARRRGDAVVACGGGTPCRAGALDEMRRAGVVVWLDAAEDVIVRRLREGRADRPLIAAMSDVEIASFVAEHLAARCGFYSRADMRFDSSRLENEAEISSAVESFKQAFNEIIVN